LPKGIEFEGSATFIPSNPNQCEFKMEYWDSSTWKAHIALACISCEKVVLFTTEDDILRTRNSDTVDLFIPTVCFSCESDEKRKTADAKSNKDVPVAVWMPLSISKGMVWEWKPYSAMNTFLGGRLFLPKKLSLVHRDEVRDMAGSNYKIQSVKLNPSTEVAAQLDPYLQSGFF